MRFAAALAVLALALPAAASGGATPPVHWRDSRSLGFPWDGRLVRGVQLPAEGKHFFTWDPVRKRSPDRGWRRYGSDRLIRTLLRVLAGYAAAHPAAPRVGIGDIARPHGGDFGPQFGGLGHASHQNGLDVDVYYPRRDGRERAPRKPSQIDRALAQDLLDRFLAAGAEKIFVGPSTHLNGPQGIVEVLALHDDHMHVRLPGDQARAAAIGRTPVFKLGSGRPNVLVVGCVGDGECAGGVVVSRAIQSAAPSRGTLWLVPAIAARADADALAERVHARRTVWFRQAGAPGQPPPATAAVVRLPAGPMSLRWAGPYVDELRRLTE